MTGVVLTRTTLLSRLVLSSRHTSELHWEEVGEMGMTDPGEMRGTVEIGRLEEREEVEIKGHGLGETVEIGECDFGERVGTKEH